MSQLFPAWGSVSNRLQLGRYIGGQHHQKYWLVYLRLDIAGKHWRWCSGLFRVRVRLELRADQRPSISRRDFSQSGGEGERWSAFFSPTSSRCSTRWFFQNYVSLETWTLNVRLQRLVNICWGAVGSNKYPNLPTRLSLTKSGQHSTLINQEQSK